MHAAGESDMDILYCVFYVCDNTVVTSLCMMVVVLYSIIVMHVVMSRVNYVFLC